MSDEVRIDKFHTVPALKGLSPSELDVVDDITYTVALKPGQSLFKEGDIGDGMYLIVSGSVEIFRRLDKEAIWKIAKLQPGACFGEMALLSSQSRIADCVALEPSLLLKVPYKDFNALIKQSNIAALKVTSNLARVLSVRLTQLIADQTKLLKAHRTLSAETQKQLMALYQQAEGAV